MVARSVVAACGVIVAVRYRRDPALLAVTLLPQFAALIGYAFWLGDLEAYYYVSLMAALTAEVGVSAVVPRHGSGRRLCSSCGRPRAHRALQFSTLFRMPQYETFVRASRVIVRSRQPMRAVRAGFRYPGRATRSSSSRFLAPD
jgi:hypothetical protein